MTRRRIIVPLLAATLAAALGAPLMARAAGFVLPPSCATVTAPPDGKTPLRTLRKRVEAANETDPTAAFAILCTAIPRAAAEYGENSAEFAWWAASLATPLIA